jgi:hypothetical protein
LEHDALTQWPSVADVSRSHRVSLVYLYRLLGQGRLSGVKTRVGWLVDPHSVAAWAATRRRERGTAEES